MPHCRPERSAAGVRLAALLLLVGRLSVAPALHAQTSTSARVREDFNEFFTRFRQDSSFQLSRIRFPLAWYSVADQAQRQIARAEWRFEPFYSDQATYTQVFDNFALRLADTDERVYALIGVATDIRQNYYFRRLRGRWWLVRVEDLSM